VAGRMARARHKSDFGADLMIPFDKIGETTLEDRSYAVGKDGKHVGALGLRAPVLVLNAAEQIARLREGWDPLAVDEHRVPADVIDV